MKDIVKKKRISIGIALISGLCILLMLFFVSPANAVLIAAYAGGVTLFSGAVLTIFIPIKRSALFASGIGIFLLLSAFIGFDIVQTILLLFVIIGVDRLIHTTS